MDDKTKVVSDGEHDYIALPSGFRLGKYELQAVLGQGGFGITYRAWDRELDRPVAIKEYLPSDTAVRVDGSTVKPRSRAEDEGFAWGLTRFLDEARALARFENAHAIVRVYDYMAANGTAYMVMALVDGMPLSGIYRREAPLDEARLKSIVLPLLQGLEQVHEAGFLHRDIKPANILIRRDGNPVLIDFGAARQAVGEKSRSVTAVFTPGYAPFEQYMSSGKQGPWTDIYALAATLYHGITGKVPPQATDRIRDDDMEPAVKAGAGRYSPEFLAAIDAGLAVFETARPQTVAKWREMLLGHHPADINTMPLAGAAMVGAAMVGAVTAGAAAGAASRGGPASQPSLAPTASPSQGGPPSMGPGTGPPTQPSLGPGSTQIPSQGPNSYVPMPAPRKRTGLWLGLGALIAVVLAGGGYAAYSSLQSDRQSIEARLKAEEDARLKAEDDARKKAVEAAELRVREEERQKAAAAAAAADAKRKADEEAQRQAAAAAAAAEAKRKADDEAQRQAAAAAAAAEAKRKADEAAKLKAEDDARKKAEAERKKAEDDARRKAEDDARKKAETEKKKAEDDARRKAEEDARKKAEEDARKKAAAATKPSPAPAPAPAAAVPQVAPQVASAPGFAYAGSFTLVIDCPSVQSPPFVSYPMAINGPNIAARIYRDGVVSGTISGNSMTLKVSFTGRSGDHFDGSFTLTGDGNGFKGSGVVVGFSRGFHERSCPISIQK